MDRGSGVVVDCHAHYIPVDIIQVLREGALFPGIALQESGEKVRFSFPGLPLSPPAPTLISHLPQFSTWQDDRGIDAQILSPWTDLLGYTLVEDDASAWVSYLNDCMIADISGSHRFASLAAIPLPYPGAAVAEIRRAKSTGHRGVVIGTSIPGVELDDPRLEPIWAELARADMPVLLHPIFLERDPRMQPYGLANAVGRAQETTIALSRLLLSGVLIRNPGLRVVVAHGGGTLPFLLRRLQRAFELSPEASSPAEGFGRLYLDSVVLDPRVLRALLTFTTPDRILLGSDYPFPWEPDPVSLVDSVFADRQAAQGVLGANAYDLFGLDGRDGHLAAWQGHHGAR
jgi:aminocarboxymuconate-semialdehyde decarboxylase